jgi:hypothetical protein
MAAGDITTVAAVQQFLSIADVTQDAALLQTLVSGASAFVLNYLNRNLLTAAYVETRNGHGGDTLPLYQSPVTAVTSLVINGATILPATSPYGPGYVFDSAAIYLRQGAFTRGVQNVVIGYTAGLAVMPLDLVQAATEMVAAKYKRRTELHVSGKTLNGETITYNVTDIPASAKSIMAGYMRAYML